MYARFMQALARRAGIRVFRFYSSRTDLRTAETPLAEDVELRPMEEHDMLALCSQPSLDLDAGKVSDAYARGGRLSRGIPTR